MNTTYQNETYLDTDANELVTRGFTWVDSEDMLHIDLPTLEERLNAIGYTLKSLSDKEAF